MAKNRPANRDGQAAAPTEVEPGTRLLVRVSADLVRQPGPLSLAEQIGLAVSSDVLHESGMHVALPFRRRNLMTAARPRFFPAHPGAPRDKSIHCKTVAQQRDNRPLGVLHVVRAGGQPTEDPARQDLLQRAVQNPRRQTRVCVGA